MARTVEVAIVEGLQGKTRAQQMARLKEWKKHWLSEGADKIVISEVGPGTLNPGLIFAVHHKSGAAYGATHDVYFKNPKAYDTLMEKWIKAPVLNVVNFAVTFENDEI
jgi:hypothetical protein